jgi:hypothetical protein
MDNNQNKELQDRNVAPTQHSKVLAVMNGNSDFNFVLKKTERLTSGVYLITGFFDEKEPLKWKLRSLASNLLSTSLSLKNGFQSGREGVITDMRNIIVEIVSLLTVSKNVGLISDANYNIIDEEFSNLLEHVTKDTNSELSKGFFSESILQTSIPKRDTSYREAASSAEDFTSTRREVRETPIDKGQRIEKVIPEGYLPAIRSQEVKKEKPVGAVSIKKNSRQGIILDIVKKKKEIMIKDVAPLITGCSEKTIQRELLAMVSAGILKKEGEKRWSKYSLISE